VDVPWGKVEQSADEEIRYLGDDLTKAECPPRVELGLLFSSLKDISVGNEFRLSLSNDTG
jgi:hypothetical protein